LGRKGNERPAPETQLKTGRGNKGRKAQEGHTGGRRAKSKEEMGNFIRENKLPPRRLAREKDRREQPVLGEYNGGQRKYRGSLNLEAGIYRVSLSGRQRLGGIIVE